MFKNYSKYYDLIYKDKDYKKETEYINSLIQDFTKIESNSLLDLGCGSGSYSFSFSDLGYDVSGVDLSSEMVAKAQEKGTLLNKEFSFSQGDIRNFKLEKEFPVVISLFHVISYLTSNNDLVSAFENVYKHLKPGGLFIFDYWYGPGVLTERPSYRLKEFKSDELKVKRFTTPTMKVEQNVVDVHFSVLVNENNSFYEFEEIHKMRYFFTPELNYLLEQSGFEIVANYEWLKRNAPSDTTWYGIHVIRKK